MKKPHAPEVRRLLRAHDEGLTVSEIMKMMPAISRPVSARRVLENMPDAYIDRWVLPKRGQWQAVWCIVTPPPHCPYPTERFHPETRWAESSYARPARLPL